MADLMMEFESIGIGCEFGVVQRCCGAEPLGLFRFTGSDAVELTRLLTAGLADFMTPDDVGIEVSEREFMVFSRSRNGFRTHTHASIDDDEEADVLEREIRKVGYLKRRFESDWRGAERIYVTCGCEDEAAIHGLHAALRTRSNCALLWVVKARSPGERGRVEIVAPGLLRGYLAHYATFEGGPRLDLPAWGMVCRAAEAMLRGSPMPGPPLASPIETLFAWSRGGGGVLETVAGFGRCRVLLEPSFKVCVAEVLLTAERATKSLAVFSVWIWLPASYRGGAIMLVCNEATQVNSRCADISVREEWQQIWIATRVVEARQSVRVCFYVDAARGSEFHLGGWQLEAGGIPHEGLRPSGPAVFGSAERSARPSRTKRIARWIRRALASAVGVVFQDDVPAQSSLATELLRCADEALRAGAFDEADQLLVAGKALFPWRAELFSHYALCAQNRGQPIAAISRWAEVVCFFPDVGLGYHRLAANLRMNGEIERALDVVAAALERHADDAELSAEAARVFAAARRWPEALAQWDRAIASNGHRGDWRESRCSTQKATDAASTAVQPRAAFSDLAV